MTDIGTDVLLVNGDLVAGTDGDAEVVSDMDCLIQDIQHEAMTYPGDLFYDFEYGWGLQDFIQKQGTSITQLELVERIKRRMRANNVIESASVKVLIAEWDLNSISISVSFRALDEDVTINISVTTDRVTVEVVNG